VREEWARCYHHHSTDFLPLPLVFIINSIAAKGIRIGGNIVASRALQLCFFFPSPPPSPPFTLFFSPAEKHPAVCMVCAPKPSGVGDELNGRRCTLFRAIYINIMLPMWKAHTAFRSYIQYYDVFMFTYSDFHG
jgi:hypothetical protein